MKWPGRRQTWDRIKERSFEATVSNESELNQALLGATQRIIITRDITLTRTIELSGVNNVVIEGNNFRVLISPKWQSGIEVFATINFEKAFLSLDDCSDITINNLRTAELGLESFATFIQIETNGCTRVCLNNCFISTIGAPNTSTGAFVFGPDSGGGTGPQAVECRFVGNSITGAASNSFNGALFSADFVRCNWNGNRFAQSTSLGVYESILFGNAAAGTNTVVSNNTFTCTTPGINIIASNS